MILKENIIIRPNASGQVCVNVCYHTLSWIGNLFELLHACALNLSPLSFPEDVVSFLQVLATHIVSDIEYISDQILMMKKGHVIGSGTPAHLLESVSNKVKELPCSPDYLEQMEQEYAVGNVFQRNGETWIRVVVDHLPEKGHEVPEHLTVEDVYLYYLGA